VRISWKTLLRPRYVILVVLASVALGFLIERLIVTDAERIQSILDDAREYALAGKWDEVIDLLDPDYDFEGMSREDLRQTLHKTMQGLPLKHYEYFTREVEVLEGGRARAEVTIVMQAPPGLGWDNRAMVHFKLAFLKRADTGWLIHEAKMIQ